MDLCSSTGRGVSLSPASTSRSCPVSLPIRGRRIAFSPAAPAGRRHLPVLSSSAAVPAPLPSGGGDGSFAQKLANFPNAFWKFLRPHTIRGTILGTTAITAKALMENPQCLDWALLPRALLGLVALLCGNGYIVGINQIYDVDIDVVNKPFLPVASGELSPAVAWGLCLTLAATGAAVVASNFGSLITSLYTFGLFLGTVYSVPPLRLKQYAVPAFLIIATVRGFLLNFGVYSATRAALGLPFEWSPAISFITVFVTIFAIVIAITKDLPDVEGDQANNISTFATRMGVRNVALLAIGLLMANYLGAVALALTYSTAFNVPLMAGAHAIMGCILLLRTLKLHASNYSREGVASFYRWIWNLFYAEYALLPFL